MAQPTAACVRIAKCERKPEEKKRRKKKEKSSGRTLPAMGGCLQPTFPFASLLLFGMIHVAVERAEMWTGRAYIVRLQ